MVTWQLPFVVEFIYGGYDNFKHTENRRTHFTESCSGFEKNPFFLEFDQISWVGSKILLDKSNNKI